MTDELEVRDPLPHEVGIRVLSSGICLSDYHVMESGGSQFGGPVVLGHEAAGIVEKVGAAVATLTEGDMVAVHCQVPCLSCDVCRAGDYWICDNMFQRSQPFQLNGTPVSSMARVSSFASHIVVDACQAVPTTLGSAAACLVGCAGSTGYGSAANVAQVRPGQRVLILGLGGIGAVSLRACQILEAEAVFAADINSIKQVAAEKFGATDFILLQRGASVGDMADQLLEKMDGPVDAVIDFTGSGPAVSAAVKVLHRRGRLALVGQNPAPQLSEFDLNLMTMKGLTIVGALNGACDPFIDLPKLVRLAESGALRLEKVVSHTFPLDRIEDAIAALIGGEALRIVLDMG